MRPWRTAALGAAALVLALGAGASLYLRNADHDPRYANVVSIAEAPPYQDAALLERAWALPVAALYREDGYEAQANPSFCGPTSAANVAQSLGINADQRAVVVGTPVRTFLGFAMSWEHGPGVTLDQEAELIRIATGQTVTVLRGLDIGAFRAELRQSNDPRFRYVANFNRAPLWGSGHGHISPILGYLEAEDLVFVGDVNDEYGPFLTSPERLLEAINTTDTASGEMRGLLRVGPVGD
jgi:hypothetical protein